MTVQCCPAYALLTSSSSSTLLRLLVICSFQQFIKFCSALSAIFLMRLYLRKGNIKPKVIQWSWRCLKAKQGRPSHQHAKTRRRNIESRSCWKIGIPSIRICLRRQKQLEKADSWGGHHKSEWQRGEVTAEDAQGTEFFITEEGQTEKGPFFLAIVAQHLTSVLCIKCVSFDTTHYSCLTAFRQT